MNNLSIVRGAIALVTLTTLGCDVLFGTGDAESYDDDQDAYAIAGNTPVGESCVPGGEGCRGGGVCTEVGTGNHTTWICAVGCDASACPSTTRCTSTPEGRLCLERCDDREDCSGFYEKLCIRPGLDPTASGVCYPDGATSGEVIPKASLSVVRVVVSGPSKSPGLEPGRSAALRVEVQNTGSINLNDLTATLEKKTALITDVTGAASGPHSVNMGNQLTVTDAKVTVAANAVAGENLPLVLHLRDGETGAEFDLDVSLRVETSLARLAMSRTELVVSNAEVASLATGTATRVRLHAMNLGLTSTEGASANVVLTGPVTGVLSPVSSLQVGAGTESLVAEGTLTRTAPGTVQASVTLAGTNLPTVVEVITLPE
ncbi:MAG: hypothetical protein IV100_02430 [Myxococcales bacterium]|nr:hypothetical protein [Myxococcales bacterium]